MEMKLEDRQRRIYRFAQLLRDTYLQYLTTYRSSILQNNSMEDFEFLKETQNTLPLVLDQAVTTLRRV